jgi:subtilisin family serine protease
MKVRAALFVCLLAAAACVNLRPQAPRSMTGSVVSGSSLLPDAGQSGRVVSDPSGLVMLEYERANATAPARVFANEAILVARDAEVLRQVMAHVQRQSALSPLRPVVVRTIPGQPVALIRATAEGINAPGSVAESLQLPEPLASAVQAYPNTVLRLFANQDLLDPADSERQWALFNPGIFGGGMTKPDADVDGVEALARMRSTGPVAARDILVAVLDSGIDAGHEALAPALWRNAGEKPGDGVDNDGNGYVDDIHGWNFADNTADLSDWRHHGTHVSGIIAARRPLQAGKGMWGIAPFSKILVAKLAFRQSNLTSAFAASSAVQYAADMGADVMNMSFGDESPNAPFHDAVTRAAQSVHMVAAAGNDGRDLMKTPVYPCSWNFVICVFSTTSNDERAETSNYDASSTPFPGRTNLFIAAPGDQIWSTLPSTYGVMSGTSMASPLVAGTLAAIEAMHPGEGNGQHRARLFGNADRIPALEPWVHEGRRLNAYQAIYGPATFMTVDESTPYCAEEVTVSHSSAPVRRSTNRPYANSGEPGVNGSDARPYTVCIVEQLSGIRDEDLGRVFELRQHILWKPNHYPIGGAPRQPGLPFRGILRGNGYSVYRLALGGGTAAGLIAHLGASGQVLDLNLRNVRVNGVGAAGGVAGISEGRIVNVHVDGRIEGRTAGGLAGEQRDGVIDRSYFSGEVVGTAFAGGLVGSMGQGVTGPRGVVRTSQARATVRGGVAGGIAGVVGHRSEVEGAYAWVYVPAGGPTGGVAGRVSCGSRVSASYAEGVLRGDAPVGTLVGSLENAHIANSYASILVDQGPRRGGTMGESVAGTTVTTDNGWVYVCTRTQTAPPTSTVDGAYYNSLFSPGGGGGGEAKTPSALRQAAAFPGWFTPSMPWHLEPGYMPLLKGLPRSW